MDMGPWGLVTLALGATPTLTAELELLPVEELLLPVLDEELFLLADELELDLPPALAPAFELELAAALRPNLRLATWAGIAMLASIGARPRAIVISQRLRFIRSLRANGLRNDTSTQNDAARAQEPTTTRAS